MKTIDHIVYYKFSYNLKDHMILPSCVFFVRVCKFIMLNIYVDYFKLSFMLIFLNSFYVTKLYDFYFIVTSRNQHLNININKKQFKVLHILPGKVHNNQQKIFGLLTIFSFLNYSNSAQRTLYTYIFGQNKIINILK